MTTPVYVSSSGSNTSPYETWAKAATSFPTGLTQASTAGDTIYMDDTDTYVAGGAYNPDFAAGTNAKKIKLISSTFNTTTYNSGAAIAPGNFNLTIAGAVEMYGMTLTSGNADVLVCDDPTEDQSYYNCTINAGSGAGDGVQVSGSNLICRFVNCTLTVDFVITSGGDNCDISFAGCNIQSHGVGTALIIIVERSRWFFETCDLTDWTTLVNATWERQASVTFRQCALRPAGVTLNSGTMEPGNFALLERSSVSTSLTIPVLGLQEYEDFYGTISTTTAIYRTAGAADGEQVNAYSYKMTADATNALEFYSPLKTPWFTAWVDGGSAMTLTFHIGSGDAALDDSDVWLEMITPDESDPTTTTQADYRTSRTGSDIDIPLDPVDPLATPAALTSASSDTWQGSYGGTADIIAVTFTPAIAGPIKYRLCVAKPSAVVYFDPKFVVT